MRYLGIVIILLVVMPVWAADFFDQKRLILDQLDTDDGLSQSVVLSITQDHHGFIWLGTQEGLNRFDGYSFETFYHDPDDPSSLSNNWIRDLLIDHGGRLWIATDGGLNLFNAVFHSFKSFMSDRNNPWALPDDSIRTLFEDRKGQLWIGTNLGLSLYLGGGRFSNFTMHEADPDGSSGVTSIYEDSTGILWVGTGDGSVLQFDREAKKFLTDGTSVAPDVSGMSGPIYDILEVEPGLIWIVTFNQGIVVLDSTTGRMDLLNPGIQKDSGLSIKRVRSILKTRSGEVWAAGADGVYLWDSQERIFSNALSSSYSNSEKYISGITLFEDSGGVIWVGTSGSGVHFWNNTIVPFTRVAHEPLNLHSLSSNRITAFAEDIDGSIWIGTREGLNHWYPDSNRFHDLRKGDLDLSNDVIVSLLVDRDGRLWVGTLNRGIKLLEPGAKYFELFSHVPGKSDSLSSDAISKIYEDDDGRIWITTFGGGVNRHLGQDRFRRYPEDDKASTQLSDMNTVDIVEDANGMMWVGTDGGGITLLDPDSGLTNVLEKALETRSGLSSNNVITLLRDGRNVWIGTRDGGLNLYSGESGALIHYDTFQGLASNAVYGLLADESGRVWISGNKGISMLEPKTGDFSRFDTTHGLQGLHFNQGASLKTSSGNFLFGGNNGFNVFDPNKVKANRFIPPIKLTRLTKFNQTFRPDVPSEELAIIDLEYTDYVIGFEFAAMDFTAPEKNEFQYELDGFDRDWVDAKKLHQATYTNLKAGSYKFRVRGSNNDNIWNNQGLSISVNVNPPLWAAWWARVLLAIGVTAFLYWIWRFHTHQLELSAEGKYRQELQLYIDSLEEASDCVLIADKNERLIYANNAVYTLLSKVQDEVKGNRLMEILFTSENDAQQARDGIRRSGRWQGEVLLSRGDEFSTAEVSIQKVMREEPQEIAYVGIARDVTERKKNEAELEEYHAKLEELVGMRTEALTREVMHHEVAQKELASSLKEKDLLLKEIHHRVKNNMQVISSLLHIQADSVNDERFEALLGESQQRIKSMAIIHENLYQSENMIQINFRHYVEMLTASLIRFYRVDGISVVMDISVEDISLDIETAVPCGLIINELVSNALKHGLREYKGMGKIAVSFTRQADHLVLSVSDNGIGVPQDFDFFNSKSMGMEIVQILTEQLMGNVQLIKGDGTEFRVFFPDKEVMQKSA